MREFLKKLVKNRNPFFSLICEFNFLPSSYIHRDRIKSLMPEIDLSIFPNFSKSKAFSKLILKRLDLLGDYFFDFREPFRYAALLDTDSLFELFNLCGAAFYRVRISHLIRSDSRKDFERNFGKKVYRFAVKRAPLLLKKVELFDKDIQETENLVDDVKKVGLLYLKASFFKEPPSLVKRLLLKFPNGVSFDSEIEFSDKDKEVARDLLTKILIHEVKPQWASFIT